MRSKDNRKLQALLRQPFKITGAVVTSNAAANADKVYYLKPAVPCKLLSGKLHIVTGPGAGVTIAITKETAVTDPDLPYNTIKINTAITAGTAVSSDDLLKIATGTANTITIQSIPGANYADAVNYFNPKNNDALVITIPDANHDTVMAATLELEFLPI